MPIVIQMQLKASWQLRPDTRHLHGLACALFEDEQSAHSGADKPFTVWPVSPATEGGAHDWEWRAAWLPASLPPAAALAPAQIRLGHVACTVAEARQRSVTHAQLAAAPPLGSATVTFMSPTYFSQNGTDVVLPDPRLMAWSWRRRWNASLPAGDRLAVDEDAWRQTSRALRLADFDLRTERRDSGRGHERAGFAGSAVLRVAKDAPTAVRAVFGTLVRFAEFCGTGAQTTHGFGATTVVTGYSGSRDGRIAGPGVH